MVKPKPKREAVLHIRAFESADAPPSIGSDKPPSRPCLPRFALLGETIYRHAQAHADAEQGELLASLLREDSAWEVYCAELDEELVGFVSLQLDADKLVGEIGLNAVHPEHAGKGIGTALYEHALARMRAAGMRVATVATGGDPSHAPARRAYAKAGFNVTLPSVWMCREL